MNSEAFKKAGYQMIDYAIQYMATIDKREPLPHVTPGWLAGVLPTEAPQKGEPFDKIFGDFEKCVVEGTSHWQHRQFAAYFPAGNSWPSIMGAILSNATGVNGTTWDSCPVVTELEMIVADWVAKMMGIPKFFWTVFSNPETEGGGCIQTSASDSILLAMIAAREDCVLALRKKNPKIPRAVLLNTMVAYRSNQCHSSVERAGLIGSMRLRALPSDEFGNVRARTLVKAVKQDIEDGLVPYLYVAVLGSTGTCAFDDLMEIGPVCQDFGMWLHVDAAYAGSSFTCPEMRYLSMGMEYAWSLNTNMNKWMLTNFDLSFLWLRYRAKLAGPMSGYDQSKMGNKNPEWPIIPLRLLGTPATRRFRAIKMWFVLRTYGVSGMQKYHRSHIQLSKLLERYVQRDERFEVNGPTRVGLCCFRLRGTNDINDKLLEAINASRKLHMVPSYFHEKYVIRYAPCSEFLNEADIDFTWRVVDEFATAIIHQFKKAGTDVDVHSQLYEIQQFYDDQHQAHPDQDWDQEEKAAEAFVSSHEHEKITDLFSMSSRDGSYGGTGDDAQKSYDDYLHAHPEILVKSDAEFEPGKVTSMLRMEIVELHEKEAAQHQGKGGSGGGTKPSPSTTKSKAPV